MTGSHGKPLVFAHRGASKTAPENTLPAFEAAVALGADGVELDVQASADGKLVVFHNPRLEGTTNGFGAVSAQTFDRLRALDAGSRFGAQFAGTRIPTLSEVFDLLRGKLLINVEIKSADLKGSALARAVIEAVHRHGIADQIILSSFNPFTLRAATELAPGIEGGLLLSPDLPGWMRWQLTRRYSLANALHPEAAMTDERYVERAHAAGMAVRCWTVDEEAEMRRLIALGVDAIITDVPDRLRRLLV